MTDGESLVIISAQGGILTSTHTRYRAADVSMRIGAPALDNTHDKERFSGITSGQLPQRDDANAIARVLWKVASSAPTVNKNTDMVIATAKRGFLLAYDRPPSADSPINLDELKRMAKKYGPKNTEAL